MATRLSIFPLPGAILFPELHLPLHIFEPRYRDLVTDALARDRRIGMIQPQNSDDDAALFSMGCIGKIDDVEALDDGCFNIVLKGEARFTIARELDVSTRFRQVEAVVLSEPMPAYLSSVERAGFEREAKKFANTQGYEVNWEEVETLDDVLLINSVSQIAPFDIASKQALLEAETLNERCELLIQLMAFFGRHDDAKPVTLQ